MGLLAPCPTPILEDQSVSLSLDYTLWHYRHLLVVKLPPALLSRSQSRTSRTTTTRWRHIWEGGGCITIPRLYYVRGEISLITCKECKVLPDIFYLRYIMLCTRAKDNKSCIVLRYMGFTDLQICTMKFACNLQWVVLFLFYFCFVFLLSVYEMVKGQFQSETRCLFNFTIIIIIVLLLQ
jgi:hypothetical protein